MKFFLRIFRENFVIFVLLALLILFSIVYPRKFWSPVNISAIFRQFLRLSLFALGPTMVVTMGSMDLTYVGIWMLGGVLTWYLHPRFGSLAILVYPLLGLGTGFLTGLVQVKAKIPSFILTLSVTVSYWGLTAWLSGGYPRMVRGYRFITSSLSPYVPMALILAIPIMVVAIFIMKRTKIGTYLYAIGSNEEGAELSGIDVKKYKILAFTLSGLFTGVSLIILFPLLGGAAPTELRLGNLVEPLIAIVLGGTPLVGGSGGPEKTLLGALTFAVIQRGLGLAFLKPELVNLLLGLIVLGAIFVGTRKLKGMIVT